MMFLCRRCPSELWGFLKKSLLLRIKAIIPT